MYGVVCISHVLLALGLLRPLGIIWRKKRLPSTVLYAMVGMRIVAGGWDDTQLFGASSSITLLTSIVATAPALWHMSVFMEKKHAPRTTKHTLSFISSAFSSGVQPCMSWLLEFPARACLSAHMQSKNSTVMNFVETILSMSRYKSVLRYHFDHTALLNACVVWRHCENGTVFINDKKDSW